MADILSEFLVKPEDTQNHATWDRVNPNLPSPDSLRRKILIKHKKRIVRERQQPAEGGVANAGNFEEDKSSSDGSVLNAEPELVVCVVFCPFFSPSVLGYEAALMVHLIVSQRSKPKNINDVDAAIQPAVISKDEMKYLSELHLVL